MGIKAVMYIKLPYAIQLNEAKDYLYNYNINKFEEFQIEFLYNSEDDEERYNDYLGHNVCVYLKIIAIYNELNYEIYPHKKLLYQSNNDDECLVDLPHQETKLIFSEISNVLNKIFSYIRKSTGMFWVENIPVSPSNFLYDCQINYYFYSPNTKHYNHLMEYSSCYMETGIAVKLNESTFHGYEESWENTSPYERYLDKAKICLHEKVYEDFIINFNISVEAYIRSYVGMIQTEDDVVYKRLVAGNYNYLDLYYNILLKYLKGKSLIDINESSFTLLNRSYKLRNALMHSGIIDDNALRKAGISQLGFEECRNMLVAFQNAVESIKSL